MKFINKLLLICCLFVIELPLMLAQTNRTVLTDSVTGILTGPSSNLFQNNTGFLFKVLPPATVAPWNISTTNYTATNITVSGGGAVNSNNTIVLNMPWTNLSTGGIGYGSNVSFQGTVGVGTNTSTTKMVVEAGALSSSIPNALILSATGYRDNALVSLINRNTVDGSLGMYYPAGITVFCPSMTSDKYVSGLFYGTAASAKNSAYFGFYSSASGSTNNYGYLGIYGGNAAITWNLDGNIGIGTSVPSGKLDVVGSVRAASLTLTNSTLIFGDNTTQTTAALSPTATTNAVGVVLGTNIFIGGNVLGTGATLNVAISGLLSTSTVSSYSLVFSTGSFNRITHPNTPADNYINFVGSGYSSGIDLHASDRIYLIEGSNEGGISAYQGNLYLYGAHVNPLLLAQQSAAPANPTTNQVSIYALKTNGVTQAFVVNGAGVVTQLSSPTNVTTGRNIIPLDGSSVVLDFSVADTNYAFSIGFTNVQTTLVLSNLPTTSRLIPLRIAATCGVSGTIILPANLKVVGTVAPLTNYISGSNYIISIEALSSNRAEGIIAPVQP